MTVGRLKAWVRRPNVWIPGVFVAMFAVMLVANGTMVALALGSWRGLHTQNAYEKGLAYDERVAEARRAEKLGWRVALDVTVVGAGRARLSARLTDRDGHPVAAERVRARLMRPTQAGIDQRATLARTGPGRYAAEVPLPAAGLWRFEVAAVRDGESVYAARRVTVRP
jgi:nitrogen fixation protein FixH